MTDEPRSRLVVRLKRDQIIRNLPYGIGTPLAEFELEPGVTLEQVLAVLKPVPVAEEKK